MHRIHRPPHGRELVILRRAPPRTAFFEISHDAWPFTITIQLKSCRLETREPQTIKSWDILISQGKATEIGKPALLSLIPSRHQRVCAKHLPVSIAASEMTRTGISCNSGGKEVVGWQALPKHISTMTHRVHPHTSVWLRPERPNRLVVESMSKASPHFRELPGWVRPRERARWRVEKFRVVENTYAIIRSHATLRPTWRERR